MTTHREIVQNMPVSLARRPRQGGYPVPWFVPWNPEVRAWDFRYMGPGKVEQAITQSLCWTCGESLGERGARVAFVIGPMCAVNRTSAEPPNHVACGLYAARACPFLARPKMKRPSASDPGGGQDVYEGDGIAGVALMRNPGVAMVWVTDVPSFDPRTRLFDIGDPKQVRFFAHGRDATREEIEHSIDTGLPHLQKLAEQDGPDATAELARMVADARDLLPA
jgi:hypothetical protein